MFYTYGVIPQRPDDCMLFGFAAGDVQLCRLCHFISCSWLITQRYSRRLRLPRTYSSKVFIHGTESLLPSTPTCRRFSQGHSKVDNQPTPIRLSSLSLHPPIIRATFHPGNVATHHMVEPHYSSAANKLFLLHLRSISRWGHVEWPMDTCEFWNFLGWLHR